MWNILQLAVTCICVHPQDSPPICVVTPAVKHSPSVCLIIGKCCLVTQPTPAPDPTPSYRTRARERDWRKDYLIYSLTWTSCKPCQHPFPLLSSLLSLSMSWAIVDWKSPCENWNLYSVIPTVCGRHFFLFFIIHNILLLFMFKKLYLHVEIKRRFKELFSIKVKEERGFFISIWTGNFGYTCNGGFWLTFVF